MYSILCLFNNGISDMKFCLSSPQAVRGQRNFIGSVSVEKPFVYPPDKSSIYLARVWFWIHTLRICHAKLNLAHKIIPIAASN